jgi:acyl-CoA synthetase (AMP-forming)/AMP-acid ligase II
MQDSLWIQMEAHMIFRSPYADVTIPEISLTDFIFQDAQMFGDKAALIDAPTGRSFTFHQLIGAVKRTAAGLAQRGVKKGDVFAILSPNLPEFAIAFHGILSAGAIVTTMNPLYTADEIAHQLNDSGAKYLLTIPLMMEKVTEAVGKTKVQEVFVFGESEGATPFATLLQNDGQMPEVNINAREDLAILPYSSGTTGLPKGVMLTHYNMVAGVIAANEVLQVLSQDDIVLGILPFFHIAGLSCVLEVNLYACRTLVTLPRFELKGFLQTIQQYKIQHVGLVPPIVLALAKHPAVEQYDLSSLKLVSSGAAPLGAEVENACSERLKTKVAQGYGMTEAAGLTHGGLNETGKAKPATIGYCSTNVECKVIDPVTTQALGINQQGELLIRGPMVMKGYWNNPAATADSIDEQGWYHTGDIGYADEDGYFYVLDRVKELIKYKALQVAPAELEAVLLSHAAIADAAVIPSPDEEAGEVPKAFVVLKAEATAEEIMSYVAERVAPHKKIRRLEFIEQIPKSAAGKILRRVLIDRERQRGE